MMPTHRPGPTIAVARTASCDEVEWVAVAAAPPRSNQNATTSQVNQVDVIVRPSALPVGALHRAASRQIPGLDGNVIDNPGSASVSPLTDSPAEGADGHHDALHSLNAVQRLLIQAIAGGSDRGVVSAFAEALAVSEDVEVRGYIETVQERFQLDVMLAGSDQSAAPTSIRPDALPDGSTFVRLAGADIERLRFRCSGDVLLSRVGDPACVSWLIALTGDIPVENEARLLVYIELLDQALRTVVNQAGSRLSWSILEHLLPAGDRIEPAVQGALTALTQAVGGAGAALVVTMLTGMHVLSLGDADVFSVPRPFGEADEIVATSRILDRYSMTLAVRRLDGQIFTRRERHLLDVAAPIFSTWLTGTLQQPAYAKDRRGAPRRFDDIIERMTARAVEEGDSLCVVLLRVGDGAVRGHAMRRWVADIRGQLRPTDLAGLVNENEVAILLADTDLPNAAAVVSRLRRQIDANDQLVGLAPVAVGIVCSADRPVPGSVLRAARDDSERRIIA